MMGFCRARKQEKRKHLAAISTAAAGSPSVGRKDHRGKKKIMKREVESMRSFNVRHQESNGGGGD